MKILCVADHIDPLVYSTQIKERFRDIDLVVSAGDLPLEYYNFIVSSLNVPLFFIFGNHNLAGLDYYQQEKKAATALKSFEEILYYSHNALGATYLDDQNLKHRNLLIAGLGGSLKYNSGKHQYTEWAMYLRIFRMLPRLLWNRIVHNRYLDILLTHAPPRGIHDKKDQCHTGFKAFISFMNWFKPKYLIHGHIHLYELNEVRQTGYKNTTVVNCYDHIVLELKHDHHLYYTDQSLSRFQQSQNKRIFFSHHPYSKTSKKSAT